MDIISASDIGGILRRATLLLISVICSRFHCHVSGQKKIEFTKYELPRMNSKSDSVGLAAIPLAISGDSVGQLNSVQLIQPVEFWWASTGKCRPVEFHPFDLAIVYVSESWRRSSQLWQTRRWHGSEGQNDDLYILRQIWQGWSSRW